VLFVGADAESRFATFLRIFIFQLGQLSLTELRSYIEGQLLDHQLGISDRGVFHELKELVERHAIELHRPITKAVIDDSFRSAQRRFLLPQVFPVDKERFLDVPDFRECLLAAILSIEEGYVVVTGLPGSGKSTLLSQFFDSIESDDRFAVCRYLCFVSPDDDAGRLRIEAEALRVNLLSELNHQFRNELDRVHDYSERRFAQVLSELGQMLLAEDRKLVVLIDGLDHAERNTFVRDSVLAALPASLPQGVVFVIGTQELQNWQR
jgi:hypothetical protein